jgi:hypothetical protein
MSVFKTTFSRALQVYPSQYPIPNPFVLTTGVQTDESSILVSPSSNFITNGVSPGDVIYVYDDGGNFNSITQVTGIISESEAQVANPIAVDWSFVIYQQSAMSGLGNQGCYLYVGGTGTLVVTTIGGDSVTFAGVAAGTVLPVQVLKLEEPSTATLVIALW